MPTIPISFGLSIILLLVFTDSAAAFGAGYVARGSHAHGSNYRHGDILMGVYFLKHVHSTNVRKIYFGNWLRDFSQLVDRKAIELVPEPILRAVVAVFAHIQFGYTTGDFEVTTERLGCYRPEEHIDNPKGYDVPPQISQTDTRYAQLRPPVTHDELQIHSGPGMKNYIANQATAPGLDTSRDFIEKQLIAAVACGRMGNSEAYIHLGAALHTLEDFVAHSNWLELCLQMMGTESTEILHGPQMKNVFAFTGGAAKVETKRGPAPPLVTGTFGALDLYQSLLGEIDDKLSAMSIPGLRKRIKDPREDLSSATKSLIGLLKGVGGTDFIDDIATLGNTATSEPADWGKLNETPGLLWDTIKPIMKIRDKIVQWVYDHLTIDVVASAIAAISSAVDKFIYLSLGMILGPVLQDISAILAEQSEELLVKDQEARLLHGKDNIFDDASSATDPTHSQLCKDHYGHPLNELAGLVAIQITTSTIKKIVELWQPNSSADVRPVIDNILETLHHPFNYSKESDLQSLMVAQVFNWSTKLGEKNEVLHGRLLEGLDKAHQAALNLGAASQVAHTHVSNITSAHADPRETIHAPVNTGEQHLPSQDRYARAPVPGAHDTALQHQNEGFIPPLREQGTMGDPSTWNQTNQPTDTGLGPQQQSLHYGSENVAYPQTGPLASTCQQDADAPTVYHPQVTQYQHPPPGPPPQTQAGGLSSSRDPNPQIAPPTLHHPAANPMTVSSQLQTLPSAASHTTPAATTTAGAANVPGNENEAITETDTPDSQPLIITHLTRNITDCLKLTSDNTDSNKSAKRRDSKSGDSNSKLDKLDPTTLLPQIAKIFEAAPSPDVPNPIDHALTLLPGIPILNLFNGIEISEIVAAPGMGVVLKDGVIALRLRDEEALERDQKEAHRKMGGWEERTVKQWVRLLEEPGRVAGRGAGKPPTFDGEEAEGQDGKGGAGKMDRLMEKLKLRKGSSGGQ